MIHTMPTLGIDTGGTTILIEGFGFYPQEQMTLHWGGASIPASALEAWFPGPGLRCPTTLPSWDGIVAQHLAM